MFPNRSEDDNELQKLLAASLRKNGNLIPITDEEVAHFESEMGDLLPLPEGLKNCRDFLNSPPKIGRLTKQPSVIGENTQSNLARAAREGREIPTDVEELMNNQRQNYLDAEDQES